MLGPEFGGTGEFGGRSGKGVNIHTMSSLVGVVLFASNVAGCVLYILGFVEAMLGAFGAASADGAFKAGSLAEVFPQGYWMQYAYASALLLVCLVIVAIGARVFAASSFAIWLVLMLSIASVFGSLLFNDAGADSPLRADYGYTGPSLATLRSNMAPHFQPNVDGEQSFFTLFALLFPACTGIMAGANMSGDLRAPSRAIPRGTLYSLGVSFVTYASLMLLIAACIERHTLVNDYLVLQYTSFYQPIVITGIFSATLSSALGSLIGASRILQAVANDRLVGGALIAPFARGFGANDGPLLAVLLSYALVQLTLLIGSVNAISPFVTVFFLASYGITNLACCGPALTSAPNWRPTFRYFRWWTAALGALLCFGGTFMVNYAVAGVTVVLLAALFIAIHYTAPQTEWGDLVSKPK